MGTGLIIPEIFSNIMSPIRNTGFRIGPPIL